MLKQLIDEKSNEIFVLQTAGKGTSCPACLWQTVLHAGTAVHIADKWQPALSLSRAHVYLTLWFYDGQTCLRRAMLAFCERGDLVSLHMALFTKLREAL